MTFTKDNTGSRKHDKGMERYAPNSIGRAITTPLISVIIPVYNVAPYLREALDSVVGQTYKNLQIIVVDDGSTDGSGEICDEYRSDHRITVIHQSNCGPSSARNVGLDLATGDLIAFLDSDDAYHLEFVQRMLDTIIQNDTDIVECASMHYQFALDSKGWEVSKANECLYDRPQALRGLVYGKFSVGVCNKLYRRKLWKEIRFPVGHFHEDIEVVYSIFSLIDRLYYLDQPLYLYRHRMGSTVHTFTRKMTEDKKLAYDHIVAFVKKHSPEVFGETDLYKVLKSRMVTMIGLYLKGAVDTKDLRGTCEGIDPQMLGVKGWLVFYMIRWCPCLIKILFPIYIPIRSWILKITGR